MICSNLNHLNRSVEAEAGALILPHKWDLLRILN